MDWQGHSLLGLRAAQGLPAWEIEMLKPNMHPEEIGQSIMPKITNTVEKLGAYCLMLDWVYQPAYEKYCRLEEMVEETFEGSMPAFIAAFTKHRKISDGELDEIQKMIDRYRKENKNE